MISKATLLTRNAILSIWARFDICILTAGLLGCSAFFFIGAQRTRSLTEADHPELFADGDIVEVLKVIDGDELLIGDDRDGTTKFRILGIKSFSATVSDPLLSEYGKICFDYLDAVVVGKKARLLVADKGLDDEGRLLGTLFTEDGDGEYMSDLAVDLLGKGYTLVYTRFDFPEMAEYLDVQRRAKQANTGFWSNERIAARAESMLLLWKEEKNRDD
jgi:endonuclease YncB( thermonuclease family)